MKYSSKNQQPRRVSAATTAAVAIPPHQLLQILLTLALVLVMVLASACDGLDDITGGGDDEDNNQSSRSSASEGGDEANAGNATVILTSSTLQASLTQTADTDNANDCNAQIGVTRYEGVCLTPTDVGGMANFIDAVDGSLTATFEDSARIVRAGSAGTGSEVEGAFFGGGTFNLTDSTTFNSQNELFSAYERRPTYTHLSFSSIYLSTKFRTKGRYVTMLLVSHKQPYADSPFFGTSGCNVPASIKTQSRFTAADIFAGMTFERGDYLFCVKDNATDTCAAGDYQWFDTATNQLVSTRPSAPRVNQYFIFDAGTCTDEGDERYAININYVPVIATFATNFALYADYTNGINSQQWPDAIAPFGATEIDPAFAEDDNFETPYLLYYYQPEGGSLTEGSTLGLTIDFDVTDMLLIPNLRESDYDSATLEQILAVIDTKTNIGFNTIGQNQQVGWNIAEQSGLSVSATISVTGGRTRPAATTLQLKGK